MRIGQLKEIQISLKDTDLLEMEGGFNSYKLPLRKLFEYIKTKLNLAQVAFTGDYYHLKNIPPVRVASKSNLGLVRIGDNLLISPDGVLSAIPFSGWRNPDWEEEDETLASYIENKPDLSLFATRIYVDVKDKEILDESKGYTNKEVEVTLDVLRNYTDTSAENTLNSAKTYTDSRQQSTLDSANQYTDKAVGGIVDQAKEYTDEREVAIRETISASQETSKEYTDTKVSSTLEESKEYTDSQISASEGREDTKFATVNERIDGIENTLDEGYVLSVDGKSGAVDLSGSYEQKRKNNLEATTDPTPNDDSSQGYEILSKWINQSTGEMWVCLQDTVGEANWQHHTLTIDELGSAATADVGTASNQLPTNATVDSKISTGMDTKVDKVAGKQLSDENFTAEEKSKLAEAITSDDPRLVDSREWIAPTVTQEEAEEGTSQERRAWTAERDRQATEAWWNGGGDKEKLDGIEDGATKNSTDAELRDRTTHTGEQPITSVTGLQEALDGKADSGDIPDVSGFATKQEVEALDQSLAPVAKSGLYSSLVGTPSLGSASEKDVTDFATATQGSKADTAVQPEALTSYALKTEVPQTADDLPAGTLNKYITQEEKEKLATMEGSHYKGLFVSLTELIESVQDPVAGDYADVDAGSGSPISRYIWDPSDNEWVEQTGDGEPLSNAQIKERYEANPNTNAFEDDEKAKLATVQVGATKNSTDVELRDRSTHTGVQPISSVEGLQESLGGKLNVNGVNPTLQSVSNLNLLLKSGEDTSNVIKATVGDEESWHIGKDSADSDNVSFRNSKLGTSISLTDLGVVTDKNFFVNGNQVYHQGNLDTDGFVKTTGGSNHRGFQNIYSFSPSP